MSGDPISAAEAEALERACLLGLSRTPVPPPAALRGKLDDDALPLAALAMIAQRTRFERPAIVTPLSRDRLLPDDPRPILAEPQRSDLIRLLSGGERSGSDLIAPALLGLLSDRGVRVHPFDLPKLESALRKAEHRLGAGEQAYLALKRKDAEPAATIAFSQPIDDGNWTEFPKRERLAFLRRRRSRDPDGARRLIEAALQSSPAPMRAELLLVLALRLAPADRPMLEALGNDRAASVRELAQNLLARLPGTAAYDERFARAAAAFSLGRAGLLRRQTIVNFTRPKQSGPDRGGAVLALLEGIALADLAASVRLSPEEFVAALSASDSPLHLALLRMLLSEARIALVPSLAAAMKDAEWPETLMTVKPQLDVLAVDERRAAVRAVFSAQPADPFPDASSWALLEAAQESPLPHEPAAAVLRSKPWTGFVRAVVAKDARARDAALDLLAFATLVPADLADELISALEPLPREITGRAVHYARLAQAIAGQGAPS